MNRLFAGLFLAALAASPALAQSDSNIMGPAAAVGNYGAYAQARHRPASPAPAAVGQAAYAVRDAQGNVVGADPDPNIRSELRREADEGMW